MIKLAKLAIAAMLLLALGACQSGGAEQPATPSDGVIPAEASPPADGGSYPAPEVVPLQEAPSDGAYPSPS